MSLIFHATPTTNGVLQFDNPKDLEAYCIVNAGKEQVVTIEDAARIGPKQRMYNYYHKVVLRFHATRAFRNAGYVGEDEVTIDYRLRSMFAKIHLQRPDGSYDIAIEDKKNMSRERLLNFIVDVIHFLETDMNETVSDSEEYKIWKKTGKQMKKTE